MQKNKKTLASRLRDNFPKLAGIVILLLGVAYFGTSAFMADRLSKPIRKSVTGTPADHGLTYESVRFYSTVDNIPLNGWYIKSSGSRVIIMFHGKDGVRNDSDGTALQIAQAFVRAGYAVLMFDFRGHGNFSGVKECRAFPGCRKTDSAWGT